MNTSLLLHHRFLVAGQIPPVKIRRDHYQSDISTERSLCAVWHYGLWSFQKGGTKLERFLLKNQITQRKLLNFENSVNGEVSKIGCHLRK